jgi:predicted DNA-binding protein (UPF0251 family)
MNSNTELVVKHPGPVSKKTPEMVEKIRELIASGLTQEQASAAVGISRKTLIRWRQADDELEDRLISAREEARSKALANIKAAGERGDWRASEAWLRMSYWNEYRERGPKVQVNTGPQLVCDEATRQRLIALAEQMKQGETNALPGPNETEE